MGTIQMTSFEVRIRLDVFLEHNTMSLFWTIGTHQIAIRNGIHPPGLKALTLDISFTSLPEMTMRLKQPRRSSKTLAKDHQSRQRYMWLIAVAAVVLRVAR